MLTRTLVVALVVSMSGCADDQPLIPAPEDAVPDKVIGMVRDGNEVLIDFEGIRVIDLGTRTYWFGVVEFRGFWPAYDMADIWRDFEFPVTFAPTSGRSAIWYASGFTSHNNEWWFPEPVSNLSFDIRPWANFDITCYNAAGVVVGSAVVPGVFDGNFQYQGPLVLPGEVYPLHHIVVQGSGIRRCATIFRGAMIDDIRFRIGQPELVLECRGADGRPNVVTRGEELSCAVSADGGEVEIESWSFTGTDTRGQPYLFPEPDDGPITDNPWHGRMAISGKVSVRARAGGGDFEEHKAQITVEPRAWENLPVENKIRLATYDELRGVDELPPVYPRNEHHLGFASFSGEYLGSRDAGVLELIQDFGPNHYLAFLGRVPVELDITVLVHPEMARGSTFYRRQAASAPAFSATPPCLQSGFERYRELILAHEGYPINPQSHSGVFLREYVSRAGPAVEDVVLRNDQIADLLELARERLTLIQNEADAVSDTIVDRVYKVPFGCEFNYGSR
jgi:hypothetical protein